MNTAFPFSAWSLDELFPSPDSLKMRSALTQLESQVEEFKKYRDYLSPGMAPKDFLEVIERYEKLSRLAYRIYNFASLSFAANTQDQAAQNFLAQMDQFMANIENHTMFFTLWWKSLEDEAAGRLSQIAGDYLYWLEEMRHFKPHTLTESEEKIINLKNVTGSSALNTLYDAITNRYTFKLSVEGEEREFTRGELMVYVRGHDRDLRRAAYQELYRVYGQDASILGQIYQALVRDWRNEQVGLRNHSSPIAARNLRNDIPDEVIETLLNVCQRNAGIFQRFFRLKARLLGLERLHRYDIYAPVEPADKKYEFQHAAEIVLASFEEFDEGISTLAQKVFDQNHLDSEVRKGKRSGAFCATVTPDLVPWVLVNYQGRSDDVATLAHELGHAIHSMLASHHTLFTQQASLPLAETASTFAEMLLIDFLLKEETEAAVRRDILFRQVEDVYATILRQAYFALFERGAHEMIHQGASIDEISQSYLKGLRDQLGDAVEVSDEFRWEWLSIPHFYNVPFYVYAYAFGQLLVLSLYQQFKVEGSSFIPRYLEILSAGGSAAPKDVLFRSGVDIFQDSFWQGGFDVINQMVNSLEAEISWEGQ
jgi:oligoendopeptidase F